MTKYVKYDNVSYFMPFLFCNDLYIPVLDKLLKDEINPIKYVFGSVYCAWGSGRFASYKIDNLDNIDRYLKRLKSYNLIPVFTFTQLNDIEKKLNDEYSNNLLDVAYNNNAHFIVASDVLYSHIKSRYPEAKMHCSVLNGLNHFIYDKDFNETKFYNEMLDKYDIVVPRPEWVLENLEKLDSLVTDINRIEVLINQTCVYNCRKHIEHYKFYDAVSNFAMAGHSKEEIKQYINTHKFDCPLDRNNQQEKTLYFNYFQMEQLISKGVKYFKIQGRDWSFDTLYYHLYSFFFTQNIPKEEIKSKIDSICLNILKENKKVSLFYV